MKILLVDLVLLLSCFHLVRCNNTRSDNLLPGQILSFSAADTLVSKQGKFELSFFCPGNCEKLFIGIWYTNIKPKTVVWIANRDNPIRPPFNNSHLELSDGNLGIINARKQRVWDSNLSTADVNRAVLLDSGNFILTNGIEIQWQSFDYPTDTWLPGARIGFDKSKNTLQKLTSWMDTNDTASGHFSLELDPNQNGELVILRNLVEMWFWVPLNLVESNFSYNPTEHSAFITYNVFGESVISRIVLDHSGFMRELFWSNEHQNWMLVWFAPVDRCGTTNLCGAFGICDINTNPICGCLQGYEPKFPLGWARGGSRIWRSWVPQH